MLSHTPAPSCPCSSLPRWQVQDLTPGSQIRQGAYKQQLREREEADLELVRELKQQALAGLLALPRHWSALVSSGCERWCHWHWRRCLPAPTPTAAAPAALACLCLQDRFGHGVVFSPRPVSLLNKLLGGRRDFAWGMCECLLHCLGTPARLPLLLRPAKPSCCLPARRPARSPVPMSFRQIPPAPGVLSTALVVMTAASLASLSCALLCTPMPLTSYPMPLPACRCAAR